MNFKQPYSVSHNAFLWLLMYGSTKNCGFLDARREIDL